MKKILLTICAGLMLSGLSAQTSPQKPATKESIDAGRKAASTGEVKKDSSNLALKKDTTGMAAKRDSLLKVARERVYPATATTSKLLLMQLVNSINNTCFKDTTAAAKKALLKSLRGLEEMEYIQLFYDKLTTSIIPSSYQPTWDNRESSWKKEMKALKEPKEFNRLMVEFESYLKPTSLSTIWINEYRNKWFNEMKRLK